jgi:HD superfamily phosphodiesterase
MKRSIKKDFLTRWQQNLIASPLDNEAVNLFIKNKEFGLEHSRQVFERALKLSELFTPDDLKECNFEAMEHIAVFHDIGKFFQEIHTADNPEIGARIYQEYAIRVRLNPSFVERVVDGIRYHDFYNPNIDPHLRAPRYMEGEIVRAADKMLDNLVDKVERYWNYGKVRRIKYFDPEVTVEDRLAFNFSPECKVKTDELTYLLTLLALKPGDFRYPQLQVAYERWSLGPKQAVIDKILSLAEEEGFDRQSVKEVIDEYLKRRR